MRVFLNIVSIFAILFGMLSLFYWSMDSFTDGVDHTIAAAVLFVTGMITALILSINKKPTKR